MPKIHIIMVSGFNGCGKSTLVRNFSEFYRKQSIVNFCFSFNADDCLERKTGEDLNEKEKLNFYIRICAYVQSCIETEKPANANLIIFLEGNWADPERKDFFISFIKQMGSRDFQRRLGDNSDLHVGLLYCHVTDVRTHHKRLVERKNVKDHELTSIEKFTDERIKRHKSEERFIQDFIRISPGHTKAHKIDLAPENIQNQIESHNNNLLDFFATLQPYNHQNELETEETECLVSADSPNHMLLLRAVDEMRTPTSNEGVSGDELDLNKREHEDESESRKKAKIVTRDRSNSLTVRS